MFIFDHQEIMAITDVYDFYRKMEDDNIILSFKGVFTADLLTSILDILESKMVDLDISPKKKRRVYNILVECFQNLYHHIEELSDDEEMIEHQKTALIMVKHENGTFMVRTGNFISKDAINDLTSKLDVVNQLDADGLRDLYRATLQNEERTEKGTAGLGFIDIARKSKNKLEYDFIDVNSKTGFFCLNVIID
jgi:hypothetical protein